MGVPTGEVAGERKVGDGDGETKNEYDEDDFEFLLLLSAFLGLPKPINCSSLHFTGSPSCFLFLLDIEVVVVK